jgi:CRP-like cAMP-binding protein
MSEIGKLYRAGEVIFRQGDLGSCMYVIQSGKVEVTVHRDETQYCLQTLGEGDFFGEMALFGNQVRSATVRAVSEVYALTLEKKSFLRRVHEDPSLAFNILQKLCGRIAEMNAKLMRSADAEAHMAQLMAEWRAAAGSAEPAPTSEAVAVGASKS